MIIILENVYNKYEYGKCVQKLIAWKTCTMIIWQEKMWPIQKKAQNMAASVQCHYILSASTSSISVIFKLIHSVCLKHGQMIYKMVITVFAINSWLFNIIHYCLLKVLFFNHYSWDNKYFLAQNLETAESYER